MSRILVVDDEPSICWSFEQALSDAGHVVTSASTAEIALQAMETFDPELILLDYRLPGMDGLCAIREIQSASSPAPVILMTAFGSLDLAVNALGQGAFDYLPKPFDLDDAVAVITRALASRDAILTPRPSHSDSQSEIVGTSRGIQEVFRQIALVARLNVPVLISGESGVGKELVARAIHRYSGRHPDKFIPICVPALNESVLESELFGHVRGAFTGADRNRLGLLQQAHSGTAFFDEIGDIPLAQQIKLLRVLEDRQVVPVGGDAVQAAEFRLIAATHQPLESMVAQGTFRQDLFYRLNVFRIHIPPLRERVEDIAALAEQFLKQMDPDGLISLSEETLTELKRRRWKGNVRELRSAIQHAAVLCRTGVITPDCLPAEMPDFQPAPPSTIEQILSVLQGWAEQQIPTADPNDPQSLLYERFLQVFEPPILSAALTAAKGNRKSAADILGLHRETLRKRLRRHGLEENDSTDAMNSR
ncbi:sigma-54-dependent transcriptional regulator [Planctomicrobium sp. SH661]|uniref:sigma-54-dependent transcriptional regulator n=1 Tax=Planctomicrobium sp. SH661 TaxID=3448124 RepID=UPI003F5C1971